MANGENGNGTAKLVWWGMGIFATLFTAGVLAWGARVSAAGDRALEKAAKVESQQDLILYRLNALEKGQTETREAAQQAAASSAKVWDAMERDRQRRERAR